MFKKLLLLTLIICTGVAMAWRANRPEIQLSPQLAFTTLQGQRITLADLAGKPALINFWASDCQSCLEEIPLLNRLQHHYHDAGLAVIAIAMAYDPPNRVLTTSHEHRVEYQVALDPDGSLAGALGGIRVTPTTLLIDSHGNLIWQQVGRFDEAALSHRIEASLAESVAPN